MPLANLKTITVDVTLTLPYACIRDSLSLYQNSLTHTRLYNAAASSPLRPREGDSLIGNKAKMLKCQTCYDKLDVSSEFNAINNPAMD